MPAMSAPVAFSSPSAAFFAGAKTAVTSVFMLVLAGTYIGIGALTHDFGLSSWWLATSTVLVWAAPAQVILITTVTTGAALFEIALAVTLSAVRLFPMVVALMPVLRGPTTRLRDLLLPTHFTAVSMTLGPSAKPGAELMKPPKRTTRVTLSKSPSAALSCASKLTAQARAAFCPSSIETPPPN
jgi:Predicted branched-chain amino acid permease (azaleucine resistance)